jgi:hypothetical protein
MKRIHSFKKKINSMACISVPCDSISHSPENITSFRMYMRLWSPSLHDFASKSNHNASLLHLSAFTIVSTIFVSDHNHVLIIARYLLGFSNICLQFTLDNNRSNKFLLFEWIEQKYVHKNKIWLSDRFRLGEVDSAEFINVTCAKNYRIQK